MRTLRIIALLFVLGILFITGTVMNGAVSGRVYAQEGDGQSFVPGGTVPGDGEQQPEQPAELPDADVVAAPADENPSGPVLAVNSVIRFGHDPYGQSDPIEWQTVYVDEENHRALMLSSLVLWNVAYNSDPVDRIRWENSTLRHHLNGTYSGYFLEDAFDEPERSNILETDYHDYPPNGIYNTDRIFVLSREDIERYGLGPEVLVCGFTPAAESRHWQGNSDNAVWWLRNDVENDGNAYVIDENGDIGVRKTNDENVFIRPAFWLDYQKIGFVYVSEDASEAAGMETSGREDAVGISLVNPVTGSTEGASDMEPSPDGQDAPGDEISQNTEIGSDGQDTPGDETSQNTETAQDGQTVPAGEPSQNTEIGPDGQDTPGDETSQNTETLQIEQTGPGDETSENTERMELMMPAPTESFPVSPTPTAVPDDSGTRGLLDRPVILLLICFGIAAVGGGVFIAARGRKADKDLAGNIPADAVDDNSLMAENPLAVTTSVIVREGAYRIAGCKGQGKRDYQEDALWFSADPQPGEPVCAVLADGMGGMENGAESSETAIESVRKRVEHIQTDRDIPSRLWKISNSANSEVYEMNSRQNKNGGATLLITFIVDNELYWISVGDSRIYLYRDGMLAAVNEEHELENRLYAQMLDGELSLADVRDIPNRELRKLTSNLGRSSLPLIDQNFVPYKLKKGDKILLCSDGVSGTLSENELLKCLSDPDPKENCDRIAYMIEDKSKRGQDNYSAVVVAVETEGAK